MSSYGIEILLFAGTTEGRMLAERLSEAGVRCTVSVATEYGAQVLGAGKGRTLLQGRLTQEQMEFLICEEGYTCAVDATHPFATEVSAQIRKACGAAGIPYLRLARDTEGESAGSGADIYEAASMREAAEILRGIPGNLFVTTGSRDLPLLAQIIGDPARLFVRVLPFADSLQVCADCGIPAGHVIAMQGPFTRELNEAMLRQTGASALLTKESGRTGGFDEKIAAARALGIPAVVVTNPERREKAEDKLTFDQVLARLSRLTGVPLGPAGGDPREYVMVAAGPGDARHQTEEARRAVEEADIVFGAPSVIRRAIRTGLLGTGIRYESIYKAPQVIAYMHAHPALRRAAVLLSGDTGLYSGAAQLRMALEAADSAKTSAPARIRCLPGISSVSALAAALQVTWEEAAILSTHGRERDVIGHLRREPRVFLLVSGIEDLHSTAGRLQEAVDRNVLPRSLRIGYGLNLSSEDEETGFISLEEMLALDKRGLYILYLENPEAENCPVTPGMEDAEFIRNTDRQSSPTPMTKEEVRTLSLSRLRLTRKAVLYDIGAGTGSVSVEAARLCPDAQVYAIEKNAGAVQLLRENLSKYCLSRVHVTEAAAPEGLEDLPSPTHVFIGGSGGAMPQILKAVLDKNPRVRIAVNCVTLETLSQVMETVRRLPVTEPRISQIAVSRAEKAGSYHLMKAMNPVCIIDFAGKGGEDTR